MSNMSYCRFRNTLGDLRDCYDSLSGELKYESIKELSHEELNAAIELLELCNEIKDYENELQQEYDTRRNL